MNDTLRLYRGDSQQIDEFNFHKTDRYCYVGKGIYLTNDLEVANTYRKKGDTTYGKPKHTDGLLKVGYFLDRKQAYAAAIPEFASRYFDEFMYSIHAGKWLAKEEKKLEEAARIMEVLIAQGDIVAEYVSPNYKNEKGHRQIRVTWKTFKVKVGYITEFHLPQKIFNESMVPWNCYQHDSLSSEIVREHFNETLIVSPQGYLDFRSKKDGLMFRKDRSLFWPRFRSTFEKYGYRGIEYPGGVNTGGKRHRAFCVWDDEWLNEHRVRQHQ